MSWLEIQTKIGPDLVPSRLTCRLRFLCVGVSLPSALPFISVSHEFLLTFFKYRNAGLKNYDVHVQQLIHFWQTQNCSDSVNLTKPGNLFFHLPVSTAIQVAQSFLTTASGAQLCIHAISLARIILCLKLLMTKR